MLEVRGLTVAYGPVVAVAGVDLRVAAGEVVALVGANGAGKSTTLKALLGLVPSRGVVSLDGVSLGEADSTVRVSSGLALSPEGRQVFPDMTVAENLAVGARGKAAPRAAENTRRAYDLFPRLAERCDQRAGTLSGGEQQMLAIGRALISEPRLLMLDEPTLGLAPIMVDQVGALVRRIRSMGVGVLLAEQNAEFALDLADRAYVLETGRVALEGAGAALQADPRVRTAFLGL